MFARCRRVPALLSHHSGKCRTSVQRARRSFASSAGQGGSIPASTNGAAQSHAAPLAGLARELDKVAPRFEIDASDVEVLKEPKDFYEVLKAKILASKRRVYLATLYVGRTEDELINTLRTALRQNPDLTVSILTDYFRGTRESPKASCASLLAPLVEEFGPQRVELRLWHTPNLTGFRERVLPKRINEGWGLQHMKLYGFDDELILSGANLSSDYFSNRQDRYHVFRSKAITDYYHQIYRAVCDISYSVLPPSEKSSQQEHDAGYAITWPSSNACVSPQQEPTAYIKHASSILSPLIKPSAIPPTGRPASLDSQKATVYPLFQLAPLLPASNSTELPALNLLLRSLANPQFQPTRWTFTAGYFNMTRGIRDLLLASVDQDGRASHGTVLTAHPEANGFFGSKGVSGMLPPAYTLLARRFLEAVQRRGLDKNISLYEWRRGTFGQPDSWTYHAKGLWVSVPDGSTSSAAASEDTGPAITLIGSSNYTQRSHTLDLEANALVLTRSRDLQSRLAGEERHLRHGEYAGRVDMDDFMRTERRVGWHVRVAMWIVGVVGGAL